MSALPTTSPLNLRLVKALFAVYFPRQFAAIQLLAKLAVVTAFHWGALNCGLWASALGVMTGSMLGLLAVMPQRGGAVEAAWPVRQSTIRFWKISSVSLSVLGPSLLALALAVAGGLRGRWAAWFLAGEAVIVVIVVALVSPALDPPVHKGRRRSPTQSAQLPNEVDRRLEPFRGWPRTLLAHAPLLPPATRFALIPAMLATMGVATGLSRVASWTSSAVWLITLLTVFLHQRVAPRWPSHLPLSREKTFWVRTGLVATICLAVSSVDKPVVSRARANVEISESKYTEFVVSPVYRELTFSSAPVVQLLDGNTFRPQVRPLLGGLLNEYNPYQATWLDRREFFIAQVTRWAHECCGATSLRPLKDDDPLESLLWGQWDLRHQSPCPRWLRVTYRTALTLTLILFFLGRWRRETSSRFEMVKQYATLGVAILVAGATWVDGLSAGYISLLFRILEREIARAPVLSCFVFVAGAAAMIWHSYRSETRKDLWVRASKVS